MSKQADAASAPAPAAINGHGGAGLSSPHPQNPVRAFTRLVALPTVIVYIVVCVLLLLLLQLMTGEINRIDSDRGKQAIGAALQSVVQQLAEQVADEATWTEAYINTYVDYSQAWLDQTWGTTARADGHYDAAVVTDAGGEILFGETSVGPLKGELADHYSGVVALNGHLDAAIKEHGDDAMAAGFTAHDGSVSAIAAAVIHGATGAMTVPADARRILWLGKSIDAQMLEEIANRFRLPVPHIQAVGSVIMAGDDSLALIDAAGDTVGLLVWHPVRPGDIAFMHATSVASLVLLIIGILVFFVLIAFRRNVERRASAEERDWTNARFDNSTGLLNRFGFEETIRCLIPRGQKEAQVAIAFIEFEGLKDVIASYGHETSEKLVGRLADLIEERVEHQAHIARLGPDEIALVRAGADSGGLIRRFARNVLDIVSEAIPLGNLKLKLAASVGVAETRVTRKTVTEPLLMAQAAMQRARETGGNHLVEFEPSIEEGRQKRLSMQEDIRRGLDADEFDLVYQPIFDFSTQRMFGVEALLRWPRRAGGPMGPGEFIGAAEASGLIEELGLFVLRRACRDLQQFPDLKVSVNVSTVQLRSPRLINYIEDALEEAGMPPQRLQLEVTESFMLAQPDRAKAIIEQLRDKGITIALDDFGTGFASVGYLRQFSCDRVKLDRTLVADVDRDAAKAALVESTMVFAFAMGLAVTAEGVERREEAAVLSRLGCHEFQGFLLSRPLTLDGLSRLVAQSGDAVRKAG